MREHHQITKDIGLRFFFFQMCFENTSSYEVKNTLTFYQSKSHVKKELISEQSRHK